MLLGHYIVWCVDVDVTRTHVSGWLESISYSLVLAGNGWNRIISDTRYAQYDYVSVYS